MAFFISKKVELEQLVSLREGETKLGENIQVEKAIKDSSARFVLLGIPEDIGPRANCGRGGSDSAWRAFLPKFLNVQESNTLNGEDILLLGAFDFSTLDRATTLEQQREQVSIIDDEVTELIQQIVQVNKIPLVIGGGHNNAYGLLKGTSIAKNQNINCINLDPHADFRAIEGRHSGNGFSYAKKEGYLEKYSIVGLHENYNSQNMVDQLIRDGIDFSTYESIFLRNELQFNDAINKALHFVKDDTYGVELDCDAIEHFPSSAQTPSGISALQARQYIHMAASNKNAAYLHLPEAAPSLVANSSEQVGKLLSYLVSDFIRAKNSM